MSVTSGTESEGGFGETIRVVVHALLIALVICTFLFQPFNIPSGWMKATLLVGDYLFVSEYSYGYSHYSIPLSPPLFSGASSAPSLRAAMSWCSACRRTSTTDYIKRVIGLPGDRIQMKDGLLYINDTPVKRERLSDFVGEDPAGPRPPRGSSAGRKRCRTASATNRSTASTTASTTTPTSTRCRRAISS